METFVISVNYNDTFSFLWYTVTVRFESSLLDANICVTGVLMDATNLTVEGIWLYCEVTVWILNEKSNTVTLTVILWTVLFDTDIWLKQRHNVNVMKLYS